MRQLVSGFLPEADIFTKLWARSNGIFHGRAPAFNLFSSAGFLPEKATRMKMDWVSRGRRGRSFFRPMGVESLEDRSLMAALDLASLGIKLASASSSQRSSSASAAALVDDSYEENDTRATARNLGTLTASKTINDLVQADANDWYRFTTTTKAPTTANVSLAFLHSAGDLDLELYNAFGQRLKISQSVTNSETVSLSGLAAGTYYARVYGYRGVTNPDYDLSVNLGTTTPAPSDDSYENNDTLATASNLGTLTANANLSNLVLADSNDWYRFTTTATGSSTNTVSIAFQNAQGNLALQLVNANGVALATSNGTGNSESVSLLGLPAGTYYARVYSTTGATNANYSLQIVAPVTTTPTDDSYENNDTFATASNLGTLTTNANLSNLVLADSNDWFRFATTATGASTDVVSIGFQNVQGNLALQLVNSVGTVISTSNGTGNTESVSLSGLAAGTYYARVYSATGATNPGYSLQIVAPVTTTTPPTTGAFDIQISYAGFTATQRAIFEQAAAKWESIIVGDLPNATYNGIAVDDLLINASSIAIDGVNGVLGQAGYDRLRTSGTRLPYHGSMEFDSADMAAMEANGSLFSVIVHEMGHVLGIGTLWSSRGLLTGAGTSNPLFIGANAVAAYNSIFGTTSTGVPVENSGGSGTRDAHWREATFRNEIMTGYINSGSNPLSSITIGSLQDLGYSVNYAGADAYTRPSNSTLLVSGTSTSGSTSSVQFSPSRSVLTSVIGQNLAAWAGLASQSRVDSLPSVIDQVARSLNSSSSASDSSTSSAIDLLFAGEANFASEGADW